MDRRRLLASIAAGTLLTAAVVGAPLVGAAQPGDIARSVGLLKRDQQEDEREGPDRAITGTALEQASAAALKHTGEGRVTGTEVGDEEGYYEVEVTLDDGRQVDVHLDERFNVLGDKVDGQGDED